jgi:hypothetical protein
MGRLMVFEPAEVSVMLPETDRELPLNVYPLPDKEMLLKLVPAAILLLFDRSRAVIGNIRSSPVEGATAAPRQLAGVDH